MHRHLNNLGRFTAISRRQRTFSTLTDPTSYCVDLLRERDYESFLIGHLFPTELRPGYFALKAFSVSVHDLVSRLYLNVCSKVELATVQDNVSNSMLGSMRMQFWRDAVKATDAVCALFISARP